MKKVLLSLIAAFLFTATATAQHKFISWGVKAGLNFAGATEFVSQIQDGSITSRADFQGGLFVEIRPLKCLSVSADVLYSGQGYKNEGTLNGKPFSVTAKLGYFNVPILANFYIWKGLALKTGVQLGVNINSNISFTGIQLDADNAIRNADLAIPVGLSYSFNWGLIIDARYTFGVSDISYDSIKELALGKTRNQVFSLALGYRF